MIKSFLREPLLHFLVLGGLLFAVWAVRSPDATDAAPPKPKILISESRIDSLIDIFAKTRQRPPTQQELRGLIDDHLHEEIFYREALALGFGEDDAIVRRRLRQKMELFFEDLASAAQPSEGQLAEFLQANPDQFRVDRKVAFRHIYLNPEKHADALEKDIAELKSQLTSDSNPEDYGDTFLLPAAFELTPLRELTQLFGEGFGENVFAMTKGEWQGPIVSGYGAHLVLVVGKAAGRLPPLEDIRPSVELEWYARKRANAKRESFENLREKYEIVIEAPKEAAAKNTPVKESPVQQAPGKEPSS